MIAALPARVLSLQLLQTRQTNPGIVGALPMTNP
jgi:hypothetical protein